MLAVTLFQIFLVFPWVKKCMGTVKTMSVRAVTGCVTMMLAGLMQNFARAAADLASVRKTELLFNISVA